MTTRSQPIIPIAPWPDIDQKERLLQDERGACTAWLFGVGTREAYEQAKDQFERFCEAHEEAWLENARQIRNRANHWKAMRLYVPLRDRWRCGLCGKRVKPNGRYTLDHIIPRTQGGSEDPDNLQLAHFICNVRKSNRGVDQLRLSLGILEGDGKVK